MHNVQFVQPSSPQTAASRVRPGDPLYNEVLDFLNEEAELLDDGRLDEWLHLLTDDVSYRMPVRATLQRGQGTGFSPEVTLFDDDKPRLTFRVRRIMESPNAHIERPATRSRRFVTNVRTHRHDDDVLVRSSLLVLQSRWNRSDYDFFSAQRNDMLRRVDGELRLARREILMDQTIPSSPSLSVFL